ncbi:hypothetical protein VHEMI06069 [[Torrubiella] hemipterigena]|uniref:Uncharacterized protein n=1 Tax=[Torrubiella] hemipterigena TaxID=1531966 RepID=A0A0A1TI77_9HYPO|nr:hypothetical protein VHEMI06069 [[Torrubiella] hemipterigena]
MSEAYDELKKSIMPEQNFEDLDVTSFSHRICSKSLRASKKRKADKEPGCRACTYRTVNCGGGLNEIVAISGDPKQKLQEYATWDMMELRSDRWRNGMERAHEYAMEQLLDLYSVQKHPEFVKNTMVAQGVYLGSALRFISNISRFIAAQEEERGGEEPDNEH